MPQAKTLKVNDCGKLRTMQEGDVIDLDFNFTARLSFNGDLPVFIVRHSDKVWHRGTLNACHALAWYYTSTKSGLSYRALQNALDSQKSAQKSARIESRSFTSRYIVVCGADGCETYFPADDALIVPVDELGKDRLDALMAGESKVFSHGGPFPRLRLIDLLLEAEDKSEIFMKESQDWAIGQNKGVY